MQSYIIKIYHSFDKWKAICQDFFENIGKTLKNHKMIFGVNYQKWEYFYSLTAGNKTFSALESQFYTYFNNFQIAWDDKWIWNYNNAVLWEILLENKSFYPFKFDPKSENTDFVFSIFRSFDNLDLSSDKFSLFVEITPIVEESSVFYMKYRIKFLLFKLGLLLHFFKYIFNYKIQKDWKKIWDEYFGKKLWKELFETKIYMVMQSKDRTVAETKMRAIFNNFLVFQNYPLNEFHLKMHNWVNIAELKDWINNLTKTLFSAEELSAIFHFPNNPKNETSLLKWSAKKLAIPVWIPTFDWEMLPNHEIKVINYPNDINILWTTDYRSTKVPVWIYDSDRLRHMYVIGKTWVGKSKMLVSLIIDDIKQWKWLAIIDPHWDLIEEALMHVPEHRKDDVIIFDPLDEKYPFALNPLDIKDNESKQVLAKWFIDIFKKYFWTNWNARLEHMLRMVFLALLDKPDSTLFDIVRALTDKDFRYTLIEHIKDDVVKNFWTNEFAWWSQQFNTEAIMPILNKVSQLLSIDALKNIFWSKENKLDFRYAMDNKKLLFVKLPKWKLQEEIMWFLGAIFVTKIYQAAMWRQWVDKEKRVPFFLYIDEFQNFATETFNEILSEARKYWLWLTIANQFIKQIPTNISDAIFWNIWTLISFMISSEDSLHMKNHFEPFLTSYDLSNLGQREFYVKTMVKWSVKDPFSLRSLYIEDPKIDVNFIGSLYKISRSQYCTALAEKKKIIEESQKDVISKIEEFVEPII